ncbi:MAG: hypothetical protein R6U13_02715 [Desulfatiglandaceae bacterium]
MTTFVTLDTDKPLAIVQDAAIEESINDASYIGPKKNDFGAQSALPANAVTRACCTLDLIPLIDAYAFQVHSRQVRRVFIDLLEGLKMFLHTLVVGRAWGCPWEDKPPVT